MSEEIEGLDDNVRDYIFTLLYFLDKDLCELELYARGQRVDSLLYKQRNDFSEEERQKLLQDLAAMKLALIKAKEHLRLGKKVHDLRKVMSSKAFMLMVNMRELEGGKLRGYGPVDEHMADYVEKLAGELRAGLREILAVTG